jgi:5-methylcytosine-specific restriction endonuclease McrA
MPYKNKAEALKYGAWYRKNRKEKDLASKARWRENNRDKQNAAVAAWSKANLERIKENNAARYLRDKKRISARNKKHRQENPEASIARVQKRRAKKSGAGGSYTTEEWKVLCKKYSSKCLACGKKTKLTADHVIPIAKGGSSNIGNIQPLCMPCNAKKHTGTTDFRYKV